MSVPEIAREKSERLQPSEATDIDAWQCRYREGRTGWDRGQPNPVLINWIETGQFPHGHAVVPGCGYGHEVIELAARGWQVTGIDFASIPVQSLRERLTQRGLAGEVLYADIFDVTFEQPVAAVFDQTCLCAIDPHRREAYQQQLARWVSPGGQLFVCFMQTGRTGGPPFDCDWESMRRLFSDSVWNWPETPPLRVEHPSGLHELATVLIKSTDEV